MDSGFLKWEVRRMKSGKAGGCSYANNTLLNTNKRDFREIKVVYINK